MMDEINFIIVLLILQFLNSLYKSDRIFNEVYSTV